MEKDQKVENDQKKENEKKKEYLWGYLDACKRLAVLEEQLQSIRQVEQAAKTQQLSDMPKGGGHQTDLSDLLVKIENWQRKIDEAKVTAMSIKVDIETKIAEMSDPDEQSVLQLRYIKDKKWTKIAETMHCHISTVHRIHGNALKNIKI